MIPLLLAQVAHSTPHAAPPPDQQLSGNWLLYAFTVIAPIAVGAWMRYLGKKAGIAEATNNITIQPPVPKVPIFEIKEVSFDMHNGLEKRVEAVERRQTATEDKIEKQFQSQTESAHERELRIGEKIDKRGDKSDAKIEGIASEIHRRLDEVFGPKAPSPRKPR